MPDEDEQAFLDHFARECGFGSFAELSPEALATSLGFDELTPERLDAWFIEEVLARRGRRPPPQEGAAARVVQVDVEKPQPEPKPGQLALPSAKKRRR